MDTIITLLQILYICGDRRMQNVALIGLCCTIMYQYYIDAEHKKLMQELDRYNGQFY
jgi:hypothetical protein